jgi:hypothetical protein
MFKKATKKKNTSNGVAAAASAGMLWIQEICAAETIADTLCYQEQ